VLDHRYSNDVAHLIALVFLLHASPSNIHFCATKGGNEGTGLAGWPGCYRSDRNSCGEFRGLDVIRIRSMILLRQLIGMVSVPFHLSISSGYRLESWTHVFQQASQVAFCLSTSRAASIFPV
jgi:hypothetical protein